MNNNVNGIAYEPVLDRIVPIIVGKNAQINAFKPINE